jgi:hypothetical protein
MRLLLRVGIVLVALTTGLVGGGTVRLVTEEEQAPPSPGVTVRPAEPESAPTPPPVRAVVPDTLLAWTPGGLPAGLSSAVARLPAVDHAVAVASGTAWLEGSAAPDGSAVDRPPRGLAIPVEVAGADLERYAPFLSPPDRAVLPLLARGQAVLGATSAKLRGLSRGATLRFGTTGVRVAGVLSDPSIGAHELFVSSKTAAALGVARERYLLIDPAPDASRREISRAIRALLPAGFLLRIRGPGETPYFRQGDAVLPPVRLKELFGEFAGRPRADGFIDPDPRWVARNIVSADFPILGPVRCHRALIEQLRGALTEVVRKGLTRLVDPGDYGGCFAARYINANPASGSLSHHSWGVALDINYTENAFGRTPRQDPRLVSIFERWGFTWGGRWLVPDGMHFEFISFAPGG